jgi:hypothetical protein
MHLCTCVSEEEDDGGAVCSETPSLLSYMLVPLLFSFFKKERNRKMEVEKNVEPGAMLCEMHDELSSIRCDCFCIHVLNGAHCSEERGVIR